MKYIVKVDGQERDHVNRKYVIDRQHVFVYALVGAAHRYLLRTVLERKRTGLAPGCCINEQASRMGSVFIEDVDKLSAWLRRERPWLMEDFLEAQAMHARYMLEGKKYYPQCVELIEPDYLGSLHRIPTYSTNTTVGAYAAVVPTLLFKSNAYKTTYGIPVKM